MIGLSTVLSLALATLTGFFSLIGNILLIIACLNKASGKINVFLVNLCVTDILLTVYTPLLAYLLLYGEGGQGKLHLFPGSALCFVSNNIIVIASTANCITILLIAVERYTAIQHPLQYHLLMDKKRMTRTVILCWTSIIFVTLSKDLVIWEYGGGPRYRSVKGFCVDEEYDPFYIKILIELVMSGVFLLIPLVITTALYCKIMRNIYKSGKRFLSIRHVNSTVSTTGKEAKYTQPPTNGLAGLLERNNSDTLSCGHQEGRDAERESVIAEIRDLTHKVDVATLKQSIRRCTVASQPPITAHKIPKTCSEEEREIVIAGLKDLTSVDVKVLKKSLRRCADQQRPKKMLQKQKTSANINLNRINEKDFEDIIQSIEEIKNKSNEPDMLNIPVDRKIFGKSKPCDSTHLNQTYPKRGCLRRYNSCDSIDIFRHIRTCSIKPKKSAPVSTRTSINSSCAASHDISKTVGKSPTTATESVDVSDICSGSSSDDEGFHSGVSVNKFRLCRQDRTDGDSFCETHVQLKHDFTSAPRKVPISINPVQLSSTSNEQCDIQAKPQTKEDIQFNKSNKSPITEDNNHRLKNEATVISPLRHRKISSCVKNVSRVTWNKSDQEIPHESHKPQDTCPDTHIIKSAIPISTLNAHQEAASPTPICHHRAPGISKFKKAAFDIMTSKDGTETTTKSEGGDMAKGSAASSKGIKGPIASKWKMAASMSLESNGSNNSVFNTIMGNREDDKDHWRMLLLMMRLAKIAKQPSVVSIMLQEKLGTNKYQIQLVKAALMSCVAFYAFTLPFIIMAALPTPEKLKKKEHSFPIVILPLINCLADFMVYGFMHPTIRHQVKNLLLGKMRINLCSCRSEHS